jgi:hypothetical protein
VAPAFLGTFCHRLLTPHDNVEYVITDYIFCQHFLSFFILILLHICKMAIIYCYANIINIILVSKKHLLVGVCE